MPADPTPKIAEDLAACLPDIHAEGEKLAAETWKHPSGLYLWTDLVGAIQTAISDERNRHVSKGTIRDSSIHGFRGGKPCGDRNPSLAEPSLVATPPKVAGDAEDLATCLLAWGPEPDDRVWPLLLAEASRRDAADWRDEDAVNVIAFLLRPTPPKVAGDAEEPTEAMWQAAWEASQDYFVGDAVTQEGFRKGLSAMLAARATASLAVEIEALRAMLLATGEAAATHLKRALAAERKLEAAVGHLEAIQLAATKRALRGRQHVPSMRDEQVALSAITTFLAAMNTRADDAE